MTGTFIASARPIDHQPAQPLEQGWSWWQSRDLMPLDLPQLARGPLVVASVLDSDTCDVVGLADGVERWRVSVGESDIPGHGSSDASRVEFAVREISDWAVHAGIGPPDHGLLLEACDRGYVLAEDGFFAILRALGLLVAEPPEPAAASADWQRTAGQVSPDGTYRSYLRVESQVDLFARTAEVLGWLDDARTSLVERLCESHPSAEVRRDIGPHDLRSGPPNGLLVTVVGTTGKGRFAFANGTVQGWKRMSARILRGEIAEVEIGARSLDAQGTAHGGRGCLRVGAVLRDQFTAADASPLPADHPAVLYVDFPVALAATLDPSMVARDLERLCRSGADLMEATSAFIEHARPNPPNALWSREPLSDALRVR